MYGLYYYVEGDVGIAIGSYRCIPFHVLANIF